MSEHNNVIPASFSEADYKDLQRRFAELPPVTLPASLTAESLWARMDADALTQPAQPKPSPRGRVVAFMRRARPVLSYAAVFVLLVAVYYGVGLDGGMGQGSLAAPAPAAAPQSAQAAAPEIANDTAVPNMLRSAPAPANDTQLEASSSAAGNPDSGEATPEAANEDAPMLLSAPLPAAAPNGGGQAECSTEQLQAFAELLGGIALREGEALHAYLPQGETVLSIYISKVGEERLRGEIDALAAEHNLPSTCMVIYTFDPTTETPGTP